MTKVQIERREKLIHLALEAIEKNEPLHSMSMRQLAKKAGFAHTNVYNFFQSMGHLQWEVLSEALRILEEACFVAASRTDPRGIIECYVHFALEHPGWYRLVFIDTLDPGAMPDDVDFLARPARRFLEAMKAHFKDSDSKTLEKVSNLLHTYVHGWITHAISGRINIETTKEHQLWPAVDELLSLLDP